MSQSLVQHLIVKDFRLHRKHIVLSIAGGCFALGLLQVGGEFAGFLGIVWFFVALIVLGSMLPTFNVVNERKKQSLPFVMSLPVSAIQYTTSKLISTFGMFLIPWLTLVMAGLSWIAGRDDIPNGLIPGLIILSTSTLVGFSIIAATALISESEGWTIAATVACNSSYGFSYYLLVRNPAMKADLVSPVAVWSPGILTILGAQIALILVILAVTFFLQFRKRDFV